MTDILIVEDNKELAELLCDFLRAENYTVSVAQNGEKALQLYERYGARLVVLDIMLPGMDGFELCKLLRQRSKTLGIIMLTARSQEDDKITGLGIGADDYITKPFSPAELAARMESLYRRVEMLRSTASDSGEKVVRGEFVLNTRKHTLSKGGTLIELTQVEYQIIELLFNNPNKQIKRGEILAYVWGENYVGEEKVVDVNIRRLRMKIEENPSDPKYLQTVWGMGYKWNTAE